MVVLLCLWQLWLQRMNIIQQIYVDALVPERMPIMMEVVGKLFRAESSFLFTSHSASDPDDTLIGQNMSPDDVAGFASYWNQFDVWAEGAARRHMMKKNVVVTGSQLVSQRELEQSRFYNEFGRRAGLGKMLGSVLFDGQSADDVPFTNLCWYRTAARDDFDDTDCRKLRRLLPHLQLALQSQRRLRRLHLQKQIADTVGTTRSAVWLLLDDDARIVDANEPGIQMAQDREALISTRNGRVTGLGMSSFPSFLDLFAYVRTARCSAGFVVRSRCPPFLLKGTLVPLPQELPTLAGSFYQPRYLLILDLPRTDRTQIMSQVARLYALTAAEADVLGLLLAGLDAGQIATQRGARMSTVRSQLRAILEKTGCTRQLEVVQLVQGLLT
jgi:DNA-binding CsgD family transcriptional regulator